MKAAIVKNTKRTPKDLEYLRPRELSLCSNKSQPTDASNTKVSEPENVDFE
jgi:hypothetical protein